MHMTLFNASSPILFWHGSSFIWWFILFILLFEVNMVVVPGIDLPLEWLSIVLCYLIFIIQLPILISPCMMLMLCVHAIYLPYTLITHARCSCSVTSRLLYILISPCMMLLFYAYTSCVFWSFRAWYSCSVHMQSACYLFWFLHAWCSCPMHVHSFSFDNVCISLSSLLMYVWLIKWFNPSDFILMPHKPTCATVHPHSFGLHWSLYLSINYICMLLSMTMHLPAIEIHDYSHMVLDMSLHEGLCSSCWYIYG